MFHSLGEDKKLLQSTLLGPEKQSPFYMTIPGKYVPERQNLQKAKSILSQYRHGALCLLLSRHINSKAVNHIQVTNFAKMLNSFLSLFKGYGKSPSPPILFNPNPHRWTQNLVSHKKGQDGQDCPSNLMFQDTCEGQLS